MFGRMMSASDYEPKPIEGTTLKIIAPPILVNGQIGGVTLLDRNDSRVVMSEREAYRLREHLNGLKLSPDGFDWADAKPLDETA